MSDIFFDSPDRKLQQIINSKSPQDGRTISTHLHPHGINEMVNTKEIRVALLLKDIIGSMDDPMAVDRLRALHSLRDEVFFSAESSLSKNTARVLLEIMKEFIRSDDELHQLELAHNFRSVMTGKPSVIRRFLKKYRLLEMPEEWNQISFDHHVHDSHTKGRKSPSHLVMDAWIKGIRRLTIIYYEFIPPEAAKELLTAAKYMDIKIRIGVEFHVNFHTRPVQYIWIPRGFTNSDHFLRFLENEKVQSFMALGREASNYRSNSILSIIDDLNSNELVELCSDYNLPQVTVQKDNLLEFVGTGQLSMLHLSEYIHSQIMSKLTVKIRDLKTKFNKKGIKNKEKQAILKNVKALNGITSEMIFNKYLKGKVSIDTLYCEENLNSLEFPKILKYKPKELLNELDALHPGYRITLNLTELTLEDVIELIYVSKGRISHLEIYNHKDFINGRVGSIKSIRKFREALNSTNNIELKSIIVATRDKLKSKDGNKNAKRVARFDEILQNIHKIDKLYSKRKLKETWGSDSTGRAGRFAGMGFVVKETLPQKAQAQVFKLGKTPFVPLNINTTYKKVYSYKNHLGNSLIGRFFQKFIPSSFFFKKTSTQWEIEEYSTDKGKENNVISLGGRSENSENGFSLEEKHHKRTLLWRWTYMNSSMKNFIKIFIGFVPAFFTFFLTKHWWVLAYLGAPIWFSITGLRNIIQSIVGGDSFKRSSLLKWNDYVHWDRVSDSLLYTGFSVPLLDYLVKTLILNNTFNINTSTNLIGLYSFMALVNGMYISTHNYFRGLPTSAIVGNFFRSILSIPLAIAYDMAIGSMLSALGVVGVNVILQTWAAVISKAASDTVAGIIEGTSDRARNIRNRTKDFNRKIAQVFYTYSEIEILLHDKDVLELLNTPESFIKLVKERDEDLLIRMLFDSLDLLYFWNYQPHARPVMKKFVKAMTTKEKAIFIKFQNVLSDSKYISSIMIDGALGENFQSALAFYLSRSKKYHQTVNRF